MGLCFEPEVSAVNKYELHLGDCLEFMRGMEANSVHAIITDLPYGTTACAWDEIIPFAPMWEQVKRVLKPNGVFVTTASQPFTSKLIISNLEWFKYSWVWNKNNSAGFAAVKYRPFIITEDVCVFAYGSHIYNPQMEKRGKPRQKGFGGGISELYGMKPKKGEVNNIYHPKNILDFSKVNQIDGDHPTQKPVALYEYLVKTYTNEGETVLDFCAGSGTTGVACMRTNRNFIGVEKELEYYNIAKRRIAQAAMQEPLFV